MPDNTEVEATTAGIGAQYDSNHAYFLHSSDAPAPAVTSKDFQQWNRCNDIETSWLLNSLGKEIVEAVIYYKTALDLWTNLEERFGQSNNAKLFHLQKELNDLVCACVYGGKKKLAKSLEDERLIQFLMGLKETYAQARSNILMIKPLPTVNHAYSLLLQDENQRETPVYNQFSSGGSSFMAGSQGYSMTNGSQVQSAQKFTGNSENYTECREP
ncbi:uncharacterized protein [Nicotiana tomentosiformis]|uniref:uncharacterized protein n=1 Tax=Nicotiana tomentosiformis TaxID=4098 RepID=UPI00051B1E94|nr:uncharacterized protein LOC104085945 [Nicotiana tomentosiformis]